jgi:hypothetical protein
MSRRRTLEPTVARKDGQLEVMARKLAKSQAIERDLRRQLRVSQAETSTALEQLRRAQEEFDRSRKEDRPEASQEDSQVYWEALLRQLQHDQEAHARAEAHRPLQDVQVARDAGEHGRGLKRVPVKAAGNLSGFVRRHVSKITNRWRSLW